MFILYPGLTKKESDWSHVIRRQYFVSVSSIVVVSTIVVFMLSISIFSEMQLMDSSSLVTRETVVLKFCCIFVAVSVALVRSCWVAAKSFLFCTRSCWVLVNVSARCFFVAVIVSMTKTKCCCVSEAMYASRSLRSVSPHPASEKGHWTSSRGQTCL